MTDTNPTAALLIIGNEILSGRTQDKNLNHIALQLNERGIRFMESRVIADIHEDIIEAVNILRARYSYVFTTGGIGPTHDDITTECIAKAFNVEVVEQPDAINRMQSYYDERGQEMTPARRRMACTPKGAVLIDNPITLAPGYRMENVFVMAGIPKIMQAMLESIMPLLEKGQLMHSQEIVANVSESAIASYLSDVQNRYPDTEIGSYPFNNDGRYGVSVVIRTTDKSALAEAAEAVKTLLRQHGDLVG
jgi:molybdenum cofactor synthesis domain-containing protein